MFGSALVSYSDFHAGVCHPFAADDEVADGRMTTRQYYNDGTLLPKNAAGHRLANSDLLT